MSKKKKPGDGLQFINEMYGHSYQDMRQYSCHPCFAHTYDSVK